MSTALKKEVEIENIGPIEQLTLTAEPGKITVLTGPNGVGKTQALNAVGSLASGKTRLGSRDGTVGGTARGFGVQIKVGRGGSNRRSGELEIESVEDRLNIAHLVDPGLKDPVASDARRIKALVTLTGVEAKPELFYDLAGGKERFTELVKPASVDQSDVVAMASAIKRDFELASRKEADVAENLEREIRAREEANEGIGLGSRYDAGELQAEYDEAHKVHSVAVERRRAGIEQELAAKQSRKSLVKSQIEYDGPTIDEADEAVVLAGKSFNAAYDTVSLLVGKLTQAKAELAKEEHAVQLAENSADSARLHFADTKGWEKLITESELAEYPDVGEIAKYLSDVNLAREAIETGVRVRDALERIEIVNLLRGQMKLASKNSESLRASAHGTEDILSRLVAEMGGPFKVDKEFRLIVQHPARGATYFAELSHGERWKLGLDVAIEAFEREGQHGLLAIPQEAWESLDADNRRLIAEHIKDSDLAVITAEASRQEGADSVVGVTTFESQLEENEVPA